MGFQVSTGYTRAMAFIFGFGRCLSKMRKQSLHSNWVTCRNNGFKFVLQKGGFLTYKYNFPLWVTGAHPFQPFSGVVGFAFALVMATVLYPTQPPRNKKLQRTIREWRKVSWWRFLYCSNVDAFVVCNGESKKSWGRDLKKLKVQCPIPSDVSHAICTTGGFECGVQSVNPKNENTVTNF